MGLARNAAGWSRRAGEGSVVLFETTKKGPKKSFRLRWPAGPKLAGLGASARLRSLGAGAFLDGDRLSKETGRLERAKREVWLIEVKLTVSFYLVLVNCTELVPRLASTISPKSATEG